MDKQEKREGNRSQVPIWEHFRVSDTASEKRRNSAESREYVQSDIGNATPPKRPENSEDFNTVEELMEKLSSMNPNHLILVDKTHALEADFEPTDLVDLALYPSISRNRDGLFLERAAAEALAKLSEAAKREGITLQVSSAYRSYDYQRNLFDSYAAEVGEEEASLSLAKPGTSQHQLGTAVDFGDVTESFASTRAGRWIEKNGGKFGWSLSYPRYPPGEYIWESWHWRWIGVDAVRLQDEFFDGSQHSMLLYLNEGLRANSLERR